MAITISNQNGKPVATYGSKEATQLNSEVYNIYGAEGTPIDEVTFAYGSYAKVQALLAIGETDNKIAFGTDDAGNAIIVAHGKLVSSKVANITVEAPSDTEVEQTVTVTYVDPSQDTVRTDSFKVIDASGVNALLESQFDEIVKDVEELEDFAKSDVVTVDTNSALTVDTTIDASTGFKTYELGLEVDGVTVKVNANNKLEAVGFKYELKAKDSANEGMRKTYQLIQTAADGTTETTVGEIDLAKDQVIKSVKLCKVEGTPSADNKGKCEDDAEYATAPGDLYLHFIWANADASTGEDLESDTWIKVTDMAPIYKGDADVTSPETSTGKYVSISDEHVISIDAEKLMEDTSTYLDYTQTIEDLQAEDASLEVAIEDLAEDVSAIEEAYLKSVVVTNASNPEGLDDTTLVNLKETDLATFVFTDQDGTESTYILPSVQSILEIEEVVAAALNEIKDEVSTLENTINKHVEDTTEAIEKAKEAVQDVTIKEEDSKYASATKNATTKKVEIDLNVINASTDVEAVAEGTDKLVSAKAVKEYVEYKLAWLNLDNA